MENFLQNIVLVIVCIVDIVISGKTNDHLMQNLEAEVKKLSTAGVRLRGDNSLVEVLQVIYFEYVINGSGIKLVAGVEVIQNFRTPENVTQLHAFLGLVNHDNCFIPNPNISAALEPLYKLPRYG